MVKFMRKALSRTLLWVMLLWVTPAVGQGTDYSAQVNQDIVPWVKSVGKLFGLMPHALDAMRWDEKYTQSCTREQYRRMLAIAENPAYWYCPTGYYRLYSDRGGYLYLEGNNPKANTGVGKRASSVLHIERTDDGGMYLQMQGMYLRTPSKDRAVSISHVPEKFYPVAKTPGGQIAFTTKKGAYSALHCGVNAVIGYTLDDAASYWRVFEAEDVRVPSSLKQEEKYYASFFAPFATRPAAGVDAYTLVERDGELVAGYRLSEVPDSTGVLLRSDKQPMALDIVEGDSANVAGNMALRNEIADLSFHYFNKAFLLHSGEGQDNYTYYRTNFTTKGWLYFWQQALVILMVEDRYEYRGDKSVASLITDLLDAFSVHETYPDPSKSPYPAESKVAQERGLSDWTWNKYNDDLLWAGLAYVRGYLITGHQRFLDQAVWAWDLLYNRGWDSDLGGGIWWSTDKEEKSGLSNNPAVCMASYLYDATGDEQYLEKAKEIYAWVRGTLRRADGAVAEKIDADGTVSNSYNVYNMGTFIEGAAALFRLTNNGNYKAEARKTIEYVMINHVDSKGIMSRWKTDGTWQSEFARGIAAHLKASPSDWGYNAPHTSQKTRISYYKWLRANADAAWETRDRVNNITGCQWSVVTPTYPSAGATWECDACASAVVMTNVVPELMPGHPKEEYVVLDDHSADYAYQPEEVVDDTTVVLDASGVMRVGSPIRVVCVGNSITDGYGLGLRSSAWPAQMERLLGADYQVYNYGVSGTTMGRDIDVSYWKTGSYTNAKNANPQILIIALGTNDADPWRWDQWGADFKKDYLAMVEEFRANGKNPIVFCALAPPVYPTSSSNQNSYIETKLIPEVKKVAAELNAYVIDFHTSMMGKPEFFPDNVHPNEEGAVELAKLAANALRGAQVLTGSIEVSKGEVIDATTAVVSGGATVTLTPVSGREGAWKWSGPNGFSSTERVVTLTNMQRGGTYSVMFTDTAGKLATMNFFVAMKGTPSGNITPYVKVTGGDWQSQKAVTVRPGGTVNFGPQFTGTGSGTWAWRGPNGLVANSREVTVNCMTSAKAGRYGVTYTDAVGRQTTAVFDVTVAGTLYCPPLVPHVEYNGSWQQTSTLAVAAGGSVKFGPQPTDGEWTWTGPNGFSYKGREPRISGFNASKAGEYIGTRTSEAGCYDQIVVTLTLK